MPSPIWSFQSLVAGQWSDPIPFPDANIVSATRRLVNQGGDTCQIAFGGGTRPPNVGLLAAGTVFRVLRDGVGWFVGTVVAPRRTATGSSESAALTINGPWWYLQNIVYQQDGLFYVPVGTKTLSGDAVTNTATGPAVTFGQVQVELSTAPQLFRSSDVILTQAQSAGVPMESADTLEDVLSYALQKGARFQVGTLPDSIAIPSQTATDQTCADVVKKVLRWMPSVVSWFNYSTDPPTLNFAARADRPPLALTMGGGAPQVQTATLQARPDLVLPGVKLQFLRRLNLTTTVASTSTTATPAHTTTDPSTGATTNVPATTSSQTIYGANLPTVAGYIATTQGAKSTTTTPADPSTGTPTSTTQTTTTQSSLAVNCLEIDLAGPDPEGIGALVATVELQGGDVTDGSNSQPFEPTPLGLAQFIYDARSVLSYEGTIAAKAQDLLDLGNPLGSVLNIVGAGDPEWTDMHAEVQNTTENTATGATSFQVGPPDHLGPSDLAALLQANRLRKFVDVGTSLLRLSGGAPLPPANPLPPPSTPPGNNGGHTGPSTAPDGGTETSQGFAGILKLFSGTNTIHSPNDGPRATSTGFVAASCPGFGSMPVEVEQPGSAAGGFYAKHQSNAGCAPGFPADGPAGWDTTVTNQASHTEGSLDLTGFSSLQYSYAELRGSVSASDNTGNTHTDDYSEDVSARLGTKSFYRVYAPGVTKYYHDAGSGYNAAEGSSSISIDRLYLVARKR